MTFLHVDPDSWVPPFEQLRTQIADQVCSGRMPAGHRLPPVRRLAADLGLAPNTVARAYRELEHTGVVDARGSRGTFVVGAPRADRELEQAADDYARRAMAAGASAESALELVRRALTGRPDAAPPAD